MNVKMLEEKVAKAEEKVAKCQATIERHKKQLEKKIAVIVKMGVDPENMGASKRDADGRGTDCYWEIIEVERKQEDIKESIKKLEKAYATLANWKIKLAEELHKDDFIEKMAPKVIVDFLEDWKKKAYEWHIKRYNDYQDFRGEIEAEAKKAERECKEKGLNFEQKRQYLREKELDWKSVQKRKASFAGQTVLRMDEFSNEEERLAWLDKDLEEEKKAKMLDLLNRITKVVGTITDASALRISDIGNLNGIITGERGKAKVETIGAGGWNIQCFHFRTLVNKVK